MLVSRWLKMLHSLATWSALGHSVCEACYANGAAGADCRRAQHQIESRCAAYAAIQ